MRVFLDDLFPLVFFFRVGWDFDVWNVNENRRVGRDERETAKHRKQLVLESENS